jgi:hypothetical protein
VSEAGTGAVVTGALAIAALLVGYVYHIIWCIDAAAESGSAIALLVVGVVLPPVGAVHGICAMLGWGWI